MRRSIAQLPEHDPVWKVVHTQGDPPMKVRFAFLLSLVLLTSLSYAQDVKEVNKTVGIGADGTVFIETYKGSITIETSDKPVVNIVARIEADGGNSRSKEDVERTMIDIDSSGGEVRIKTDYDRLREHHSWFSGWFTDDNVALPFVHYTISMPATARLSIKDYKSDSRITNLHSSIDLNTYKGSVAITGLEGSIDLETYKGDSRVDLAKLSRDSRFKTYKGQIQISLPRETGFELETDLGRRTDFDSDFDADFHSKRHSAGDIHGKVNGGGPMLRLSGEKGSFRLKAL